MFNVNILMKNMQNKGIAQQRNYHITLGTT